MRLNSIGVIKDRFRLFLWDRKLFSFVLRKDVYKVLSKFYNKFGKSWEILADQWINENNSVIKQLKFSRIIFYARFTDIEMLKEVFVNKDYSLMESLLPKTNNVVLDLGAGIGDYTLLSSLRVGNGGKVISVESDKYAYDLLVKNITSNNLINVIPLLIKISNKNGKTQASIDKIVSSLKLKKLDLIKMDIEGYEYLALVGAKSTLIKFRPKIITEIHSQNLRRKIIRYLKTLGYKLILEKVKPKTNFYLCYFK
jgi:SAM-dependent methyltransferase